MTWGPQTDITGDVELTIGENTYVTLADAEAYFAGRLYAGAWNDTTDSDKARALISATRSVENLTIKFRRTVPTQTLNFPRRIIRDIATMDDWQWIYSVYDDTKVPQEVKDSECEEAFALLRYGDSERLRLQQQGVTSITLGKMQEQYGSGHSQMGLLSADAYRMMTPWIAGAVRIVRPR